MKYHVCYWTWVQVRRGFWVIKAHERPIEGQSKASQDEVKGTLATD